MHAAALEKNPISLVENGYAVIRTDISVRAIVIAKIKAEEAKRIFVSESFVDLSF